MLPGEQEQGRWLPHWRHLARQTRCFQEAGLGHRQEKPRKWSDRQVAPSKPVCDTHALVVGGGSLAVRVLVGHLTVCWAWVTLCKWTKWLLQELDTLIGCAQCKYIQLAVLLELGKGRGPF